MDSYQTDKLSKRPLQFKNIFWEACHKGDLEKVKDLIAQGVDVNQRGSSTWFPLYMTCNKGHTEIVKELIKAGADVNLTADMGWTSLMNAAEYGFPDIVKILLEAGADVNATTDNLETALKRAIIGSANPSVVQILLEWGANPYIKSPNHDSVFWAIELGREEIVYQLLDAGVNISSYEVKIRDPIFRKKIVRYWHGCRRRSLVAFRSSF